MGQLPRLRVLEAMALLAHPEPIRRFGPSLPVLPANSGVLMILLDVIVQERSAVTVVAEPTIALVVLRASRTKEKFFGHAAIVAIASRLPEGDRPGGQLLRPVVGHDGGHRKVDSPGTLLVGLGDPGPPGVRSSHFVVPPETEQAANERRARQATAVAAIVKQQTRPDTRYIIVGDMNDPPDSSWLDPLVNTSGLGLVNGIDKPTEIPAPPAGKFPTDTAWTDRYKPSGKPAEYRLFDQVWLSPALAPAWKSAWIGRRKNLTGDGTDHDPAWVELSI